MTSDKRNFYLLLLILLVLVGYMIYSLRGGDKESFHQVVKDANERLDSIKREINKSTQLITETNLKLENIRQDMTKLRDRQQQSNENVSTNDQQLKDKIKEQEKELTALKGKYGRIRQERDLISTKLDSLADIIGNIEP